MPRLGLYLCPKCAIPCVKESGCYKHNTERKESSRRYYETNRDKIKERSKVYYEEHKDHMREIMREHARNMKKLAEPKETPVAQPDEVVN